MMTAIGIGSALPPIPTSGAMTPPDIIEKKPMSAAALPAFFPCARIASEKLAAPSTEIIGIVTSSAATVKANGARSQQHTKKSTPPTSACTSDQTSIWTSDTRPASRAGTIPQTAIAAPIPPNSTLNACAEM